VNAQNTWWPFISRDATLLHATMASVALYGDLTSESVSSCIEALRHKNEAIKGINAKLNSQTEGISDALVGAVATVASFEVRIYLFILEGVGAIKWHGQSLTVPRISTVPMIQPSCT